MADKRHSKQDTSPDSKRGGGQAVVSLCRISESGLVFWSRNRFDVAAELQVRLRAEVLPARLRGMLKADGKGWVTVRGFVVGCDAMRRSNGSATFRVSLVLDAALVTAASRRAPCPEQLFSGGRSGRLFGLN